MKRAFLSLCSLFLITVAASAQISETVKKSVEHPDREAQSAKADLYIHKEKKVKAAAANREKGKSAVAKKRKRTCGTPTSRKS